MFYVHQRCSSGTVVCLEMSQILIGKFWCHLHAVQLPVLKAIDQNRKWNLMNPYRSPVTRKKKLFKHCSRIRQQKLFDEIFWKSYTVQRDKSYPPNHTNPTLFVENFETISKVSERHSLGIKSIRNFVLICLAQLSGQSHCYTKRY